MKEFSLIVTKANEPVFLEGFAKGEKKMMKRILIIDDQKGIRTLLAEVFRREGHEIMLASNGLEALSIIENVQPHCVLLDMQMPGISGLEVLERLGEKWTSIPVIVMTGNSEDSLIESALQLGAKAFFQKPFDIYKVRDEVHKQIL